MKANERADQLVVGASFAGVSCAIEAARAGLQVVLIERKTDAGEMRFCKSSRKFSILHR